MMEQSAPFQPGEHVLQFTSPCQFGSHEHKPVVLLQRPLLKHGADGLPGHSCSHAIPQYPSWQEQVYDSLDTWNRRIDISTIEHPHICHSYFITYSTLNKITQF